LKLKVWKYRRQYITIERLIPNLLHSQDGQHEQEREEGNDPGKGGSAYPLYVEFIIAGCGGGMVETGGVLVEFPEADVIVTIPIGHDWNVWLCSLVWWAKKYVLLLIMDEALSLEDSE